MNPIRSSPPIRPVGDNGWHQWVEDALSLILARLDKFEDSCIMCRRDVSSSLERNVEKLQERQRDFDDRLRTTELRVAAIVAVGVIASIVLQFLLSKV